MDEICCIHGVETGAHYCRECADMSADIEWSHNRISTLESALVEIRDHPHCNYPACESQLKMTDATIKMGMHDWGKIDGHRCCAEIARRALDK